ncbi:unnamed protein product [Polarella glacialis]|uniref:Uncharacterized protein n=1 Tax=Polarella glacialis TaxID=89957 RepID=A0A813IAT4_POLGL|nr:unnamed protein product [Polarella glacialis]
MLQKYTQAITLLHRRPMLRPGTSMADQAQVASGLPRFAFFTHYPGDIRTVTMQIYDSYLLKALDVKLPYSADEEEPVFLRCLGSMLCVWVSRSERCAGAGVERRILPDLVVSADSNRRCAVEIGAFDPEHSLAEPVMRMLRNLTGQGLAMEGRDFEWGQPRDSRKSSALPSRLAELGHRNVEEYLEVRKKEGLALNSAFGLKGRRLEFDSGFLESTQGQPLLDLIAQLRPRLAQDPLRHPFDVAVRCLGWRVDDSMLEESLQRQLTQGSSFGFGGGSSPPPGKYPKMESGYQAMGVPGLYFAGSLGHGRDYRRSAGGFIHGFRYTARALHRILRRDQLGAGWPNRTFELNEASSRSRWMRLVLERINEAAGPYQMFGELGDVILFQQSSTGLLAEYLEELPMAYAQEDRFLASKPRIIVSFNYGPGYSRPVLSHALMEDVFTEWMSHVGHVDPLFRFLATAASRATAFLEGRLEPLSEEEEAAEAEAAEAAAVEAASGEPW